MYEYRVLEVSRIVDGDTVDVVVDLGFDVRHKTRVRLFGINTPECRTKDLAEKAAGLSAKERLQDLLNGVPVTIITNKKDKFGRYLGTLYVEGAETSVNQTLIDEGHAVPYFGGKR